MAIIVAGIGLVQTELTHTDTVVVQAYTAQINTLQYILGKDSSTITAADAAAVGQAITNLQSLAQSGIPVTHTGPNGTPQTLTYRFTQDMARQSDLVIRSMMAAGIVPGSTPTVNQIKAWQDLGVEGINLVVNRAQMADETNRSLQALIETEYIRTGNDVLAEQLEALNIAMSATKKIIETLTDIQSIRNLLKPENRSAINLSALPSGNLQAAQEAYNQAASAAYGQPISPVVDYGNRNVQDVIGQMLKDRATLAQQLSELDRIQPPTLDSTGMAIRDPNTLQGKISGVLSDMTFYWSGGTMDSSITQSGLEAWLIDNLDKHLPKDSPSVVGLAGKIQQTIDGAIQAATNLNDTQKEEFRRYMFVFEEFYKSASAMMSQINQILASMAQNIAGR